MTSLPVMADAVTPGLIPGAILGQRPAVAAYINGTYAWTPAEEAAFARKIRISVEPGQPEAARYARVLDVERFDAAPEDVAPFVEERKACGHHDATPYASLATYASAPHQFDSAPRLWLAWWWDQPGFPTPQQIADELAGPRYKVKIDPRRIWACQFRHYQSYDLSAVYGPPDFSR